MNPDDLSSQAQTTRALRALPSLPPKRRCKATGVTPDDKDPCSVIVPFYNPLPKPARFTRSGQPFQIWKEPKSADPAPPKADLRATISESVQGYARDMSLLLSSGLRHSP